VDDDFFVRFGGASFQMVAGPTIDVFPDGWSLGELAPVGFGTQDGMVSVFGGGFTAGSSRNCQIATTPASTMIATTPAPTCTISSAGAVTGTFAVSLGAIPAGYTIRVTDTNPAGVYADVPFTVSLQPDIALGLANGPAGTTVGITILANPFSELDAGACTISSTPAGLISSSVCVINAAGALVAPATGFIVSSNAPGQLYTVTVTPVHGDKSAVDFFTVTPAVTLDPTSGSPPIGPGPPTGPATEVAVTGTGFSPTDTLGCTITSGAADLVIDTSGVSACTVTPSTGRLSAKFKVGANSYYTGVAVAVTVTGNPVGDFAVANFLVTPRLLLSPTQGPAGTTVKFAGSGFTNTPGNVPAPGPCVGPGAGTINGVPVGPAPDPSSCTQDAVGNVNGFFTVPVGAPFGSWNVFFTDFAGAPSQTADQPFVVTGGPTISLVPNTGPTGTVVKVEGENFNPSDGSVSITDASGVLFLPQPKTCTVDSNGKIVQPCTFTVDSNAPGLAPPGYTVTATGTTSDSAGANFFLIATLTLSPIDGGINTLVQISGSGYLAPGGDCILFPVLQEAPPPPIGWLIDWGTAVCNVNANGILTGSFAVIGAVPPPATLGAHTVSMIGAGWVPQGVVSATFTVTLPTVTFSPNIGTGGDTIQVSGTGFSGGDEGTCALATTAGVDTIDTSTCYIRGGVVTGSFVVKTAGNPAEPKTLTVTGSTGDSASGPFTVVPQISHTLTPNPARVGDVVDVTGTNWPAADVGVGCNLTPLGAPPAPIAVQNFCNIAADFTLSGQFVLNVALTGLSYVITATGIMSGASASATLNIIPHVIVLTGPDGTPSGPVGASIGVTGTGFALSDVTPCILDVDGVAPAVVSCSMGAGGTVSGSFIIDPGTASGSHTVTVTGTGGDFGVAVLIVVPGLTLVPSTGRAGTIVQLLGSGFAAGDTGCSIASSPDGLISTPPNPLCSVVGGMVSGSFVVGGVAGGVYTVTVTGSTGDSGKAKFTVPAAATLGLAPDHGPEGTGVSVSGLYYVGTSCLLTSSPSGLFTSQSCSISSGSLTGGFTVMSGAAPGGYTVKVETNAGSADAATDIFNVEPTPTETPTFMLSPTSGPVGTVVTVSGEHYAGATCVLTSAPSGLFSSQSCSIMAGNLTGGFTVSSSASEGYIVTVETNAGETRTHAFSVTVPALPPTFILTPTSGSVGTGVTASGENYAGTICTLSSTPLGLFTSSSSTCSIVVGTLTGSFTVASGATPGTPYTVKVETNAGEVETSAFTVTVPPPTPTLALSPDSGPVGTVVTASGEHYLGTQCTLKPAPLGVFTSSTCSISGGKLTGGFTVASGAKAGTYTVKVETNAGSADSATDSFTVTTIPPPPLTFALSPASGSVGTGVTASGSNYVGTSCTLSATPSGLFTSSTCSISGGTLTGGFTVASGASGSYTVKVETPAGETKTATFTVSRARICIIATVTFGSEVSPAVQFLRNFRDQLVLSTRAGSAFIDVFNAWYYSFSPSVANVIANNDPLRAPVRVLLYPLLGVLGISALTYSTFSWAPEFAIVMAGVVASSLIGLVYLTPFALVSVRAVANRRRGIRINSVAKGSLILLALALALLFAGEVAGSFLLLAIGSSAVVLVCLVSAPMIASLAIARPKPQ
jgi:hypothetical protein